MELRLIFDIVMLIVLIGTLIYVVNEYRSGRRRERRNTMKLVLIVLLGINAAQQICFGEWEISCWINGLAIGVFAFSASRE